MRQLAYEPEETYQPDDARQEQPDGAFPDPSEPFVLSTEVKRLRVQLTALVAAVEALVNQQRSLHQAVESLSK